MPRPNPVQPNKRFQVSSILEGIRTNVGQLACTCLSEPWTQTEQKIVAEMPAWQTGLSEAEKVLVPSSEAELQKAGEQLNIALNLILQAVRAKNPVALSNALANEFSVTLDTLDGMIPRS